MNQESKGSSCCRRVSRPKRSWLAKGGPGPRRDRRSSVAQHCRLCIFQKPTDASRPSLQIPWTAHLSAMCQGRLLCFMAEPGVWFFQVRLSKPSKRTRSSVPNGSPTVFFWRRNWLGLAGAAPCTLPCSIGFVLQVNVIASIVTSIGERSNAGSLLGPSFAGPWSKGPPLTARLPSSLRLGPQRQALPRFLQAPPVILRGCCLHNPWTCNKTSGPL